MTEGKPKFAQINKG